MWFQKIFSQTPAHILHTWTRFMPSSKAFTSLISATFFAVSNFINLIVKLVWTFFGAAASSSSSSCYVKVMMTINMTVYQIKIITIASANTFFTKVHIPKAYSIHLHHRAIINLPNHSYYKIRPFHHICW